MRILEITRGHVLVEVGGRNAKADVEMLVPTPGMSDYLVFKDSIRKWECPYDNDDIDAATRDKIVDAVRDALTQLGRVVEVV